MGGADYHPGASVWAIVCFYVPRRQRGQGVARALLRAAVDFAAAHGADIVEAYPVDPDSPSYRYMGSVPMFEAEGFVETGRVGTRRHVMHRALPRAPQSPDG
jgi:GNAT superfamily N-acetyltransferase